MGHKNKKETIQKSLDTLRYSHLPPPPYDDMLFIQLFKTACNFKLPNCYTLTFIKQNLSVESHELGQQVVWQTERMM